MYNSSDRFVFVWGGRFFPESLVVFIGICITRGFELNCSEISVGGGELNSVICEVVLYLELVQANLAPSWQPQ